jgi:hypothetical protein
VNVLSVLLTLSFGGCVVCTFDPVFWWMCLSVLLMDVLSVLLPLSFRGCVYVLLPLSFGGCVVWSFALSFGGCFSVLLTLSFGGCVVCTFDPVFWWMCLSVLLTLD